jgi:hypothetical protein
VHKTKLSMTITSGVQQKTCWLHTPRLLPKPNLLLSQAQHSCLSPDGMPSQDAFFAVCLLPSSLPLSPADVGLILSL